ncbi:hypothetical protein ACFE04_028880 [Oxalis oulophora]
MSTSQAAAVRLPIPIPNPNPTPNPMMMMMKKKCSSCEFSTKCPLFIHNVRFRGVLRRLCTSCVLRLHPSSFCPTCFDYYEANPPHSSKRLTCTNCSSFTHTSCAGTIPNKAFLCRACASDPNSFKFFDLDKLGVQTVDGKVLLDKGLAPVLLCAARISSSSMHKAVVVARAEAERRIREAAGTRQRARDALDDLYIASCLWKEQKKQILEEEQRMMIADNHDNNMNAVVTEVLGNGFVVTDGDGDGDGDGDTLMFEYGGDDELDDNKMEDLIVVNEQNGVHRDGDVAMDDNKVTVDEQLK